MWYQVVSWKYMPVSRLSWVGTAQCVRTSAVAATATTSIGLLGSDDPASTAAGARRRAYCAPASPTSTEPTTSQTSFSRPRTPSSSATTTSAETPSTTSA